MSTIIANRLSDIGRFSKTSLDRRLAERYPGGNPDLDAFFASLSREEEKQALAEYVAEQRAVAAEETRKMLARFVVPFDHDGYRAYLSRLLENAKRYNNEVESIFHIPKSTALLKPLSPEEQARRRALRENYAEKVMEEAITLRAQIDATSVLMRGKVSRPVQILMVGGTFEEMEERGRILRYGTPEEKRALFTSRMTEVFDFMDSMATYKSDEDFLKAASGKRWILACLSELDKTDERMMGPFAFDEAHPLDPALKARWDRWKNLGVSLGNLANRMDKLVSPLHELIDEKELTDEWVTFLDEVSDEDVAEEVGYVESSIALGKGAFSKIYADGEKNINPMESLEHSIGLEKMPSFCKDTLKESVRYFVETKFGFSAGNTRFYTKDGRLLADENAVSEELYEGRTVTAASGFSAVDLSASEKNGGQLLPPSPLTYNRYMTAADLAAVRENAPARDPSLLNAFTLRAADAREHGGLWHIFHRSEAQTLAAMRSVLAEKGFSDTEILIAEKGNTLTAADLSKAVVALSNEARLADGPENIDRIRADFETLRTLAETEKFESDEKIAEAIRSAAPYIEPQAKEITKGEPIDDLASDVAEKFEDEPEPEVVREIDLSKVNDAPEQEIEQPRK